MNLRASMDLAGQSLLNSLCPSNHNLCSFIVTALDDHRVRFSNGYALSHNLCRWWDAMLRLQETTGFVIPPEIESIMLRHAFDFFDNPDHLCCRPRKFEDVEPSWYPHSYRENVLALTSLWHVRGSSWALDKARRLLETFDRTLGEDCHWDYGKLDHYQHCVAFHGKEKVDTFEYRGVKRYARDPNVAVDGRLIEALVWCYRLTRLPLALALADKLARFHVQHSAHPDGRVNRTLHPNHTHSYLNTLKGMVGFGALTGEKSYLDVVAATFRETVRGSIVKESGLASHDFMQDGISETSSPADAAQIALWLGLNGYPEFFDDVERLVRSRLLASQIVACPDLRGDEDAKEEDCGNLRERFIGGYGCGMFRPNAASHVYTDVTSSVLHAMTDIYRHSAARTDAGLVVYLHFDYEDDALCVASERNDTARLSVTPRIHDNVLIRIPRWAPPQSLGLTVGGQPVDLRKIGDFALIPKDLLPAEIVLEHALPERTTEEHTIGMDFTYTWRGDQIVGASPNDDYFPYYPCGPNCVPYEHPPEPKADNAKRQTQI